MWLCLWAAIKASVMTHTIDLSITILTSHHCTTTCSLVINLCYYPKKETRLCVLTHPYKAGSNTWAWYLDILEALFMRHEVANYGNKIRTIERLFTNRHCEKWTKIVCSQIQLGTHIFKRICYPLGLSTYTTVTLLAVHELQFVLLLRCQQWKRRRVYPNALQAYS